MTEGKGKQFDPKLVEQFLELLDQYDIMDEQLKWTYQKAGE